MVNIVLYIRFLQFSLPLGHSLKSKKEFPLVHLSQGWSCTVIDYLLKIYFLFLKRNIFFNKNKNYNEQKKPQKGVLEILKTNFKLKILQKLLKNIYEGVHFQERCRLEASTCTKKDVLHCYLSMVLPRFQDLKSQNSPQWLLLYE